MFKLRKNLKGKNFESINFPILQILHLQLKQQVNDRMQNGGTFL